MLALATDLLAAFLIAKYMRNLWTQIPVAILAGVGSPILANFLAYAITPTVIPAEEAALRAISGILIHPLVVLSGLWYFRRKFTRLKNAAMAEPNLPSPNSYVSSVRMTSSHSTRLRWMSLRQDSSSKRTFPHPWKLWMMHDILHGNISITTNFAPFPIFAFIEKCFIHPSVYEKLQQQSEVTILLELKEKPGFPLYQESWSKEKKSTYVYQQLSTVAYKSQKSLIDYFIKKRLEYQDVLFGFK